MNDERKPNLTIDAPPGKFQRRTRSDARGFLPVLVVLQLVIAAGVVLLVLRDADEPEHPSRSGSQAGELRDLALELENKSLDEQAARCWDQYLQATPDASDRPEILYRIGKLYMQAEAFDLAATAFVRCEQVEKESELNTKIGQNLVTCLRRLGLYGEVGRELSRRVEADGGDIKKGKVLATLAGEELTEADLDRLVERRVDQILSMQGGHDAAMRETFLQRFSSPEMRQQIFQEFLQTELYTRRARELKLDRSEEFLRARQALEDSLLANRFQAHELAKVQPTDVDIQAYFKSEQVRYREPEAMQAIVLPLGQDEDPTTLLQELSSTEDFKQLATRGASETEDASASAVEPQTIVRGQTHFELGDTDALFELEAGRWTPEPHANGDRRFLVLVESKSPPRTPPLAEVRARVENDYVTRKRQELSRQLFEELVSRYDVRLMPLGSEPADDDAVTETEDDSSDDKQNNESESN